MKVVCAWCGKKLGEKPPYKDKSETHTICEECLIKYFPHHAEKIQGILGGEKVGNPIDLCQEAKKIWSKYEDDVKAGHSEAAQYWKGQAEVYSLLCQVYSGGAKMDNPISERCEAVLEKPPKCFDFRGIRSWVLCRAWQKMEDDQKLTRLPVGEAWIEARTVCKKGG